MKITKRHVILAGLLFVAGIGLLLLPMQNNPGEATPEELLAELNDNTRFYSTDEVAQMIIDEDPGTLLIDVRPAGEYDAYTLDGAFNIPLDQLLQEDWLDLLRDDTRMVVFFSNDDILAERAWLICRRMKMTHIHIMRGGLNRWAETILQPQEPPASAAREEHNQYLARLGARQFFAGVNPAGATGEGSAQEAKAKPEKVIPVRKAKQGAIEGGC